VPLKKPPLVEVWMSFRFEPAADAPPWTRERYQLLLGSLADDYPRLEKLARHSLRVEVSGRRQKAHIKEVAEEVLAMRVLTEDGLRAVQLTPDSLVVNFLRSESEPYPGFPVLLDEALAHCSRYAECYRPNGILEAALHYVDLIELPITEGGVLRSERYITLNFQVPEEVFGRFAAFEMKAVVRPPEGAELVEVIFATEPAAAGDTHRRFRLEWHTGVKTGSRMTEKEIRTNLQAAHDRLWNCFRHAFTREGWALFEPEEP
jgi:uncharacterized protein (TIGR04255 family)